MNASNLAKVLPVDASRREFLKAATAAAGAFVLGTYVPSLKLSRAAAPAPQGVFDPNVFLKIGADNTVTIICKHFEMGQG